MENKNYSNSMHNGDSPMFPVSHNVSHFQFPMFPISSFQCFPCFVYNVSRMHYGASGCKIMTKNGLSGYQVCRSYGSVVETGVVKADIRGNVPVVKSVAERVSQKRCQSFVPAPIRTHHLNNMDLLK